MDFPIHIDKISMGFSILYFKGLRVENSKLCISVPEGCFKHSKLCRHLGLHCFTKNLFRGFQNTKG